MNKEHVLEHLKSINYPGFSRDIVSFGMVKNIVVDDNAVTVTLNISSQNENKKDEVINAVKSKLKQHFTSVNVELSLEKVPQPVVGGDQEPSILGGFTDIVLTSSGLLSNILLSIYS